MQVTICIWNLSDTYISSNLPEHASHSRIQRRVILSNSIMRRQILSRLLLLLYYHLQLHQLFLLCAPIYLLSVRFFLCVFLYCHELSKLFFFSCSFFFWFRNAGILPFWILFLTGIIRGWGCHTLQFLNVHASFYKPKVWGYTECVWIF